MQDIIDAVKFDSQGLLPAIAQDATTGEVLMMAYMNREALEKTVSTGKAHYFSRSRNRIWLKGETSGNFQEVREVLYDCDGDTILLKVNQMGVACHTGERSCFFRRLSGEPHGVEQGEGSQILDNLYNVILERKRTLPERSYVASLLKKGLDEILNKVEEEATELILASKGRGKKEIIHELVDLWFHTLVLLGEKEIPLQEVYGELKRRFGISGIEEKEKRQSSSPQREGQTKSPSPPWGEGEG